MNDDAQTSSSSNTSLPATGPQHFRNPSSRPLYKLSVKLIDTYKTINKVYYEKKALRKSMQGGGNRRNNGYSDENYDYIIRGEEVFNGHYLIKERIGKGSFGQVVRAVDERTGSEVAIKIIKSKTPFTMQARTEIELLQNLKSKDVNDENNIVRLLEHFVYRNHQCLVFEMLSLNLYELLKNTQFRGVSLNLIRKFAKQILRSLAFLSSPDVGIIHCDLKPENILLRSPKRSAIKVIDFGSSCKSDKKMYSYIQSRFYRSPEVMLNLPYTTSIDMWSLGCILVEMHTGEPLFAGTEQFDQMEKLVGVLGVPPRSMIESSPEQSRDSFFEKVGGGGGGGGGGDNPWRLKQNGGKDGGSRRRSASSSQATPPRTLRQIIGADSGGPRGLRKSEAGHSPENYGVFIDLVTKMLKYDAKERITPLEALGHAFITDIEGAVGGQQGGERARRSRSAPGSSRRGGRNAADEEEKEQRMEEKC